MLSIIISKTFLAEDTAQKIFVKQKKLTKTIITQTGET